jgi:hypothetical protein
LRHSTLLSELKGLVLAGQKGFKISIKQYHCRFQMTQADISAVILNSLKEQDLF